MAVQDNIMQIIPSIVNKYWDYSRNTVNPEDVSIFSNDSYYWKNKTDVTFHTSPLKIEKPLPSTSRAEKEIYYFLKCIFKDTKDRYKVNGVEVDVYIPSLRIALEYDGSYTHKNRVNKDIEKNNFITSQKIKMIRIRDEGLPSLNDDKIIEIFCSILDEKFFLKLLSEIKKVIRNRKILLPEETKEVLKNFKMSNIDMSFEKIADTYLLQASDPDRRSNERIVNYYTLHKDEFDKQEVWNNFLTLVYSRPSMRLFYGIHDEELVERFYRYPRNEGRAIDQMIDIFATNNLSLITYKIKDLIDNGAENWFIDILKNALQYPDEMKDSPDKLNILLNFAEYFRNKYPTHYMLTTLEEHEKNLNKLK